MIKPIKITPLRTSKHLSFKCNKCGKQDVFLLENSIVNIDSNGNSIETLDYDCPECGNPLNTVD